MNSLAKPVTSPPPVDRAANRPVLTAFDWLAWFGEQAGVRMPSPLPLAPVEMLQPFRALLVHGNDMTSTLERFYRQRMALEVLRRERQGPFYAREVVLKAGVLPVEYGVICIRLSAFAPTMQREIVAERLPLGRLLQDHAVPYISRPQEFFHLDSAEYVSQQLATPFAPRLFGRRNLLLNSERRLLADVVEILSPAAQSNIHGKLPTDFNNRLGQVLDEAIMI